MKAVKWLVIIFGGLAFLVIAALLIIPAFVDINKFKPEIEQKVAQATGRTFSIGSDLDLSLFPFAGIKFSDLKMGSLPGFSQKEFVSIDAFEVRIKLLPLLSKDIQLKRFILKGPRIVLEKNKSGKTNWKFEKPAGQKPKETQASETTGPSGISGDLPIKNLSVGEFVVSDGSLLYLDQAAGSKKEISDLNLTLEDVSLDKQIKLAFSTFLDKKPITLNGSIGPLGPVPGKGTVSFDIVLSALDQLEAGIAGEIQQPTDKPSFSLKIKIKEFSPRKLMAELDQAFPLVTTDPDVLTRLSLGADIKGSMASVSLSNGVLGLDDSKLMFSADAKDYTRPDIRVKLQIDGIDIDRYLPPKSETQEASPEKKPSPKGQKPDYTPLRRLILDAALNIGKLTVNNLKTEEVVVKVAAKDGIFNLNPLSMKLYEGSLKGKGTLNVQKSSPSTRMALSVNDVQASPLVKDLLGKDMIEGSTQANLSIRMTGDNPDSIKKTLNGDGKLVFADGAILGIDIAGMVRNAKAAFGLAEKVDTKPGTDFAEFSVPFTITNGNVKTPGTVLKSPLLRLMAAGNADLVKETLDFRIEPKLVASLKGQGDTKDRSGIMVPVLVSGTFSDPTFRPDLKGIAESQIKEKILKSKEVNKLLEKKELKPLQDVTKGLLKNFLKQ